MSAKVVEVVHEQHNGVCVGCEQFGTPVEWLLAQARGHSDERDDPMSVEVRGGS